MSRLYVIGFISMVLVLIGCIWYFLTAQNVAGLVAVLGGVIFLASLYTYRLWGE